MRKGRKNPVIAVVAAVFAVVLAACLAASALYAPAASSMYVSEETFSGEVEEFHSFGKDDERTEEDGGLVYGGQTRRHDYPTWYSLNDYVTGGKTGIGGMTPSDEDGDGVNDTVTLDLRNVNFGSPYPNPPSTAEYYYIAFYLSDDLTCDILTVQNSTSTNKKGKTTYIYLCLNGHVLRGTGNNPVIYVGAYNSDYPVVLTIYDCGGSCYGTNHDNLSNPDDGYDYNHYYRYIYEEDDTEKYGIGVVDGEEVPVRYDFDVSEEDIENGDYDGCVRGGLICGGYASNQYVNPGNSNVQFSITGGGILVGDNSELNMYGGTIAGNSTSGTKSSMPSGGVAVTVGRTFNMYGGTIEGNGGAASVLDNVQDLSSRACAGGVGIATTAVFNMYGGEIKNNFTMTRGGGVGTINDTSSTGGFEFNMYGGTISGNYAGYYGGGVYVSASSNADNRAKFNMYGGTIRDNFAESGGGGVEATTNSDVVMKGGTVTGNRALLDGYGGGIYISGSSTLTIGGSSYVYGNHFGNFLGDYEDGTMSEGRTSNIEWSSDWAGGSAGYNPVIYLSGELSEGARIGISPVTGSSGDVVYRYRIVLDESDESTLSDYVKYFSADGQGMSVRLVTEYDTEYLEIFSKR